MTRLTDADRVLRSVSEADLLAFVLDAARLYGWRTYHARPAFSTKGYRTPVAGDGIGWPDVVLLRGDVGLVAELKRQTGTTTPEQDAWLEAFRRAGFVACVWRPSDRDEVVRVLSAGRVGVEAAS